MAMTNSNGLTEPPEMDNDTAAEPEGILRDLRIFISASGTNSMFGVYVFTYRLVDASGDTVLSNVDDPLELFGGTTDEGHHAALLWALTKIRPLVLDRFGEWMKAGGSQEGFARELYEKRKLTIITSRGDAVFRAYTREPEQLLAEGFKQKSGHLWANAAYITRVLADAEELGLKIACRPAESIQEDVLLELTRNEGRRRWAAGQKELKQRL